MALANDALMERAALYQIITNLKTELESVLDIASGPSDGFAHRDEDLGAIAAITRRALGEASRANPGHLYH